MLLERFYSIDKLFKIFITSTIKGDVVFNLKSI